MFKEKIQNKFLEFYKNKEFVKKNLLSLIKWEIDSFEKDKKREMKDEEIIAILKIYIKNSEESFKLSWKQELFQEAELLKSFLPNLIEESIVIKEIEDLKKEWNNFWMIMKKMKERYPWQLDLGKVSELAK